MKIFAGEQGIDVVWVETLVWAEILQCFEVILHSLGVLFAVSRCEAETLVYQTQSTISTHQPSVYHGIPDLNWVEGQRAIKGEQWPLYHPKSPSNRLEKYPSLAMS